MFALGLKKRIKHLVVPALRAEALVISQPYFFGVLAGDVGAAKNQVPDKQQIAKIAFVMAHAVGIGNSVVRPVRGRGGDGAL